MQKFYAKTNASKVDKLNDER